MQEIAERTDLDAVIHLGDYIYEYPDGEGPAEIRDERELFPGGEIVSLSDYRMRYATYRLDRNLRQAHKQHPFLLDSDAVWKVIGNQVMFSEFNIGWAATFDFAAAELESLFLDMWDGYPAERQEIVQFLKNSNVSDTVILTGDFHASFAFEVADPAYDNPDYNPDTGEGAVAVEFLTPSLSAANFDEEVGEFLNESIEDDINSGADNPNPHMKFADLDRHGYFVLTVDTGKVQADYYYLENVLERNTSEEWAVGWICNQGTHHLIEANTPAPARLEAAPAP